jgi:hypothetical protein
MPTGGANDKQAKINFPTSSHPDNQRNAQDSADNTNDVNEGDNTNSGRAKRNRTQFEQAETSDHHLRVPPDNNGSGSDSSLFDSDSNITVIVNDNDGDDGKLPIESPSITNTTDNSVDRGTDERHKARIIRLERLRDKQDRYNSHIGFLKECHEHKVIPKGLRIDVEPSIGNNDEGFCNKWFSHLESFSLTLISEIITYSEGIKNDATTKIEEETKFLRENLSPDDFTEINDLMDRNATQRRKRLSLTKRKKFHFLRYNRPERSERNERSERPERVERQPSSRNMRRNNDDDHDGRNDRRRVGFSDNRDADRNPSNNGNRRNDREIDHADQDQRRSDRERDFGDNQRERRTNYSSDGHPNNSGFGDKTPPARNRANQNDRNVNNDTRPENGNDRSIRQKEENSRTTTYRDILTRRSRPNSRNPSFTNLRQRSNTGSTDSKQRSNTNVSRRGSHHDDNQQKQTSVESENAILRKRLAKYEREAAEAPKNATPPSEEGASTSTKATNQEILDYLTATMRNLEGFKRQLLN